MKSFFKYLLATLLGSIIGIVAGFIIIILILVGIIASLGSLYEQDVKRLKPNSILKITLDSEITDRTSNNPMENFDWVKMKPEKKIGLNDILKNIVKAKQDDKIKGIYLEVDAIPAGIATIEEIRDALLDFKESKKFIISYSNIYTQPAYYLASVADKIYLNPVGLLEFKGLNAELLFFKGTLEKLGIEPQIIRHGKFKSAVEPLICDKMSRENHEQTFTYVKSIWDHILNGISEQRSIDTAKLNNYADSLLITDGESAIKYKLVDSLVYYDDVIILLKKLSGIPLKKELEFVNLADYTKQPEKRKNKRLIKEKIAVVFASGNIIQGQGDETTIGSETISEAIRQARLDSNIKAVVLRVNSPGGDAIASDVILREITLLKQIKPVIVSMGDVAASGGYYISCKADMILASENTITGSIGVFGVLWNGKELLNNKLGITSDVVKTNASSDIGTVFRRLTPSEEQVIQKEIDDIYTIFTSHVAEGRNIPVNEVDSIGQGRVWSGANAKNIKLIDEFGGLSAAIKIAANKAGLEKYKIVELPEQEDPIEKLVKELIGNTKISINSKYLLEYNKYFGHFYNAMSFRGIQARLPYDINIY
ncbi:MAG: signal peptide peptidase SppA [Bacteroidia bacterium]|nr:signal peptide peptidase SppA [Bacteroidia bacterium]